MPALLQPAKSLTAVFALVLVRTTITILRNGQKWATTDLRLANAGRCQRYVLIICFVQKRNQNQCKLKSSLGRKSRVNTWFNAKANPRAHALHMSHIKPWFLLATGDLFCCPKSEDPIFGSLVALAPSKSYGQGHTSWRILADDLLHLIFGEEIVRPLVKFHLSTSGRSAKG